MFYKGGSGTSTGAVAASALNEISFADENVVFAGAEDGAVYVSRDAGRTWTQAIAAGTTGVNVGAMWVRDANSIWIGGVNGGNCRVNGS